MHELAITQSLVELVRSRTGGRQVVAVHVRVGTLSGVIPEALQFGFEVAVPGTPLADARLDIDVVEGRQRCRTCGGEDVVEDLLLLCRCGSVDVELLAGTELLLTAVEVVTDRTGQQTQEQTQEQTCA